jgi:hypothetical protein
MRGGGSCKCRLDVGERQRPGADAGLAGADLGDQAGQLVEDPFVLTEPGPLPTLRAASAAARAGTE